MTAHLFQRAGARRLRWACLALLAGAVATNAMADEARTAFRPCIDPNNLPFSDSQGDGFENRIAALFAQKLALPVQSFAFPQRMNFIRNTLRYRLPGQDYRCDVVMSLPVGFEQAATTRPYYRSTYVLVYARGRGLDRVKTGEDLLGLPRAFRDTLKIGLHDRSPASQWLVKHGMESQARPYPILSPDPENYPGAILENDLAQGRIDALIIWGPIGGYYARRVKGVDMAVIPLQSEPGVKFDYAIAMGVRFGEAEWKDTIERLIAENQPAITAILREYGVPLVNERGDPVP